MKRLIFLILLLTSQLYAQEATLDTPIVRPSEAKYKVVQLFSTQFQVSIEVSVQDSTNNEIRRQTFIVPDSAHSTATIVGVFDALDTVRVGEIGGRLRITNFRLLGFLKDNGYIPGTTVNP